MLSFSCSKTLILWNRPVFNFSTIWMGPAPWRVIGWCLCHNATAAAPWAMMDFGSFLGSSCRMSHNGLHGQGVAAMSHGRAFAGLCACLQWAWCVINRCSGYQFMQMCTFHGCFWHLCTYLRHNHCRECTCARVCAVCSFALGNDGGKV